MTDQKWEETRRKVLGLGEKSQQKSYFPTLKRRLKELEQLRHALDSSSDAIFWAALPDWRLLDMNAAARRLIGLELRQPLPDTITEYIPDSIWRQVVEQVGNGDSIRDGKLVTEITSRQGGQTSVELSIDSMEINNQHVVIIVARDITERLMLEAKLQQAQKLEALGVLAGGIAHDFNNVLYVMLGNADIARMIAAGISDQPEVDNLQNCINEIHCAGKRGAGLVKQILAFARKTERMREPVNILPVIKESAKMMRSVIPTTIRIELNCDLAEAWVKGDPTEIHQILMNLCTNASHAMKEAGGVLGIRIRETDATELETTLETVESSSNLYIAIEVSDTGTGIPDHILPRIFEPFFSTKVVGEGTGMGLSVVHGIIISMDGQITVDTRPGEGSRFTLMLPSATGLEAEHLKRMQVLPVGNEHILVVDDEYAIINMLDKVIKGFGYTVTAMNSSEEALELFKRNYDRYDLLITDQTMPGLTGVELVQRVHAVRSDLPVILCTGYSQTVNIDNAGELGITDFLQKPLSRESLANAIRRALDRSGC